MKKIKIRLYKKFNIPYSIYTVSTRCTFSSSRLQKTVKKLVGIGHIIEIPEHRYVDNIIKRGNYSMVYRYSQEKCIMVSSGWHASTAPVNLQEIIDEERLHSEIVKVT